MSHSPQKVFDEWIQTVNPMHRSVLIRLHQLLLEVEPDFQVELKWRSPSYKVNDRLYIYLADQKNYVHLGFTMELSS